MRAGRPSTSVKCRGLTPYYYRLIVLGISAWLLQVCAGCDEYDPCSDVEYGTECRELTDCSYVTDCWCGYCIPNMCTGEIEFSSVVLESCVRKEIDRDGGSLRYENVKGIWRIEGCGHYDWWITSLWGIQCLTGLRRLDVSGNFIRDIEPLSGLIRLSFLRLSQCQLENIDPIADLVNLTELDLSMNTHITDISPLAGLKNLQILNLSDNEIGDIEPLSGLAELVYLDISRNEIESFHPLSSLESLVELHAEGAGPGKQMDIGSMYLLTNLEVLQLRANNIMDINALSGLSKLSYVDLSMNEISDISPLVDNEGMGDGDTIYMTSNPINCTDQAANIQALRNRGVDLVVDCP
jgi:hypothetical protein